MSTKHIIPSYKTLKSYLCYLHHKQSMFCFHKMLDYFISKSESMKITKQTLEYFISNDFRTVSNCF